MNDRIGLKFWFGAAMVILASCSGRNPMLPGEKRATAADQANLAPSYDPARAAVSINEAESELVLASVGSSLKVPGLSLSLTGGDFVQVLRCNEDFVLSAPTGEGLVIEEASTSQKRWAWLEAIGAAQECKIVSALMPRADFRDIAAKSGSFYYILNPCVMKEHSKTSEAGCSFNLVKSGVVTYENTESEQFILEAEVLQEAEAVLTTHTQTLLDLSRQIQRRQVSCEDMWAHKEAANAFWRGVASMSAFVVGAVVAGVATEGAGALAGGQTVLAIARPIFSGIFKEKPLKCDDVAQLVLKANRTTELFSAAVNAIEASRQRLAQMNADYAALDQEIAAVSPAP